MSKLKKFQNKMNRNAGDLKQNRKKVAIIFFVLTLATFFLFVFRMGWIVIVGSVQGTDLAERTRQLYTGTQIIQATRGTIYDRYGNSIAEDATSYSLYAVLSHDFTDGAGRALFAQPQHFSDLANILHDVLGMERQAVIDTLRTNIDNPDETERFQVEFGQAGSGITLTQRNEIIERMETAELHGLYFNTSPARAYPNGNFASMLIGRAVLEPDEENNTNALVGQFGIEAAFNDLLSGTDGEVTFERNARGFPIPGTVKYVREPVNGQNIYTTLDSRLQSFLETAITNVYNETRPENITVTLMQANTGEILAMSQRPSMNLSTGEAPENMIWRNIPVEDNFEPGSTMKVFTTAASINQGQFNPNEVYQAGRIEVWDTEIHDHDWTRNGYHPLTFLEALEWSSNVGMVILQQRLGSAVMHEYQRAFGFGGAVNSGLPNDNATSAGSLPSIGNPVDMAMSSFGQGISVTGMQMMRGFTAIANNGIMLQPQYISKIIDPNEHSVKVQETEVLGQPIKASTAQQVLRDMIGVGTNPQWGTAYIRDRGPIFSVPGTDITLALKTGTAQIPLPDGSGYMVGEDANLSSVVIMAPAEHPQYILYLTIKLPNENFSSVTLSEIANPLLRLAFDSDETPASADGMKTQKVIVPQFEGQMANPSANAARRLILNPVIIGNGQVVAQSIAHGEEVSPNTRLLLRADGNFETQQGQPIEASMIMPDVSGWSREELEEFGRLTGTTVHFSGEGTKAIAQNVALGATITEGQEITITLGQ